MKFSTVFIISALACTVAAAPTRNAARTTINARQNAAEQAATAANNQRQKEQLAKDLANKVAFDKANGDTKQAAIDQAAQTAAANAAAAGQGGAGGGGKGGGGGGKGAADAAAAKAAADKAAADKAAADAAAAGKGAAGAAAAKAAADKAAADKAAADAAAAGKGAADAAAAKAAADKAAADKAAADAAAKAAAGNNAGGGAAAGNLQTSLTLDPSVIAKNFADDGQNPPVDGQTASQTSTNNYINFCALTLPKTVLTNGQQVLEGSCNAAPIGLIPSVDLMPSCKFQFPTNTGTVPANKDFTVLLNIKNLQTGTFTNALKTYFAAPQTLNAQGVIIGHSHITIEALTAIDATTPLDPKKPFFFKGINTAAVNGVLSVVVTGGVKPGPHRLCSINTSANHAPAIVPVAQHGSLDDCIYFTGV